VARTFQPVLFDTQKIATIMSDKEQPIIVGDALWL
jgi:hypothetical protein